jgi:tetratricopeptide (TPR) repeat protein
MKRYFSGPRLALTDSPPKRVKTAWSRSNDEGRPNGENEPPVPRSPSKTRRNGVIFEHATIPRPNDGLPGQEEKIPLSQVDFTQPPPEWFVKATAPAEEQVPVVDVIALPVPETPRIVDFLTLVELEDLKNSLFGSVEPMPSQPRNNQDDLLIHVEHCISKVLEPLERGVRLIACDNTLRFPEHVMDAITYFSWSLEFVATSLTAGNIRWMHMPDVYKLKNRFEDMTTLVIRTTRLIDSPDLHNVIPASARGQCACHLVFALEMLFKASTQFDEDGSALENLIKLLPSNLPATLSSCSLTAYKTLIEFRIAAVVTVLVTVEVVTGFELYGLPSTIDKIGKLILTAYVLARQLDHVDPERLQPTQWNSRNELIEKYDIQLQCLRAFYKAKKTRSAGKRVTYFELALDLARRTGLQLAQGECLYRLADILLKKSTDNSKDAAQMLLQAMRLNPDPDFQAKIATLLARARAEALIRLNYGAEVVMGNTTVEAFGEAVEFFAEELFKSYPVDGVEWEKLLEDGTRKGLFNIVRIFHPDKNRAQDVEGRRACEEITKVWSAERED